MSAFRPTRSSIPPTRPAARPRVQAGLENAQRLGDGLADGHARIQARERILKDDLQVAAQPAQRRPVAGQ